MDFQDRRRRLVIATIIGFAAAFVWMIVGFVALLAVGMSSVLTQSNYLADLVFGICTGGVLSLSVGLQGWTIQRPQRVWQLALASIGLSAVTGCATRLITGRPDLLLASVTLAYLPTLVATVAAFVGAGLFIGVQEGRKAWFTIASGAIGLCKALTYRMVLSDTGAIGSLWMLPLVVAIPVFYFIAFHVFLGLEWGLDSAVAGAAEGPAVAAGSPYSTWRLTRLGLCAIVPGAVLVLATLAVGHGHARFYGWSSGKTDELAQFVKTNPTAIKDRDELGDTMLMQAVKYGNKEQVEWLLARDANVNLADSFGETPLAAAAERDSSDVALLLIEKGADVNGGGSSLSGTPLFKAIEKKNDEMIELLQKKGADVNALNFRKDTPLHAAVRVHARSAVEFLLAHGADPAIKNMSGQTPLELARTEGSDRVVELLQAKGGAGQKGN